MSLVFMSGWETIKALDSFLWPMWSYSGNSGLSSTIRRGPSYAFYFQNASEYIRRVLPTTATEFYSQVCLYWPQSPGLSPGTILRVGKNSHIYFTIYMDAAGFLNIYTGDTATKVATGTTSLFPSRWYSIEVHFKCNASGAIEIRLDGISECEWEGDTTLGLSAVNAVARLKFNAGALGVDSIGSLPDFSVGSGTPVASTTHFREGSNSVFFDGSSWLSLADASLPSGFLLKNGDTTQKGTFLFWMKPVTIPPYNVYYEILTKFNWGTSNICFDFEMTNGNFRVNWAYGSSGQGVETQDTLAMTAGKWYHVAWSFDGPGKRWDLRLFNLYDALLSTYSRDCWYPLRTNCTAGYGIGSSDGGGPTPLWIDDLWMVNAVLPNWQMDCIRSLYYDPLFRGQDPYPIFQSNWMLEIASPGNRGMYVDDVIVNDVNGSINNSWVDRAHVVLHKPTGLGMYGDFTLSESSASSGADLVYKVPASITDFIYSNTPGATHMFKSWDTPLQTLEVLGIMECAGVWRSANAGLTFNLVLKAGNTTYVSSDLVAPLTPTPEIYMYANPTDPYANLSFNIFESDTGVPFSAVEIDSMELGLKVK